MRPNTPRSAVRTALRSLESSREAMSRYLDFARGMSAVRVPRGACTACEHADDADPIGAPTRDTSRREVRTSYRALARMEARRG